MSVSSIGAQSALIMQQLVQMRSQFDDLQRQLGTGQKSATYAGLGINRGVTVSLNAQLAAPGDPTKDPTKAWPDDREVVTLGVLTIDKLVPDSDAAQEKLLFLPGRL